MKKLILISICIGIFFSNSLFVNAGEGEIEKILNLPFAVEQIEFELSVLPNKSFENSTVQTKYDEVKDINKVLTDELYKQYTSGNIDYYTTNGIITNHKVFIYNVEKLFAYIELKLENPNYIDVDQNIISSYSQMKTSFNRIKYLYGVSKSNKEALEIQETLQSDENVNSNNSAETNYYIEYENPYNYSNYNSNYYNSNQNYYNNNYNNSNSYDEGA